jgi:hypothetical protein
MRITESSFKFPRNFKEHKKRNLKCDLVVDAWHKIDLTHYIALTYFKLRVTVSQLHKNYFWKPVPLRAGKGRGGGKTLSL